MLRRKGFWIGFVILLVLAGVGGYAYFRYVYQAGEETPEPTIATSQVLVGDLVLSVSGTGTLMASEEADLGFETGGYLAELLVGVGDIVQDGDVLARLETDDLETAILEADVRLRLANMSLEELLAQPEEGDIANVEAAIRSAENALSVAQYSYSSSQNSTVDASVRARQIQFQHNVDQFYAAEASSDGSSKSQNRVDAAWSAWTSSEADLDTAMHQAEIEQLEAWHAVEQAENRLAQAQQNLQLLCTGPATDTVLRAELNVTQAQLSLDDAREALEGAELRAPFGGTVVDVAAVVGQRVASGPILTLANLAQPLLELWAEEQDMSSVLVGNRIEIIFDALQDLTFSGEVIRIDPALVTVDRTLAVQAWATVDVSDYGATLLAGMSADVEVISAEARNTLQVPLQALRELGPENYAVFVVGADGELELRPVQVGLMDFANAEILSGVEAGDAISLGVAQTTEEVVVPEEDLPGMPGGGGGVFIIGGRGPGGR